MKITRLSKNVLLRVGQKVKALLSVITLMRMDPMGGHC